MIKGMGEKFKEEIIVQKILISLPMRFNAKVSTIKEMANLKDLKKDQLHGTLTTYEMRVGIENPEPKEETFKVSRNAKEHKDHQGFSSYESNQELAQLARKLMCGSGKYKGRLRLNCFDCGRVGHFSSKCPYKEKAEKEEDRKFGNKSQKHHKEKPYKKKGFYSKKDSSAPKSNNENTLENDSNKYLLMAFETDYKKQGIMYFEEEEEEEEEIVYFEGEFISSLDELKKVRKKNKQLKE